MYKSVLTAAIATSLLTNMPMAKADPESDAMVAQVKQLAMQGQNPQIAAQVSQFVDENHDAISAIMKVYLNYLKQIRTMTDEDAAASPGSTQSTQSTGAVPDAGSVNAEYSAPAEGQQPGILQLPGGPQPSSLQPSSGLQASSLQPSTGLQTSSIQPSGGLRTAHLAGFPALPDIVPISSVTQMSVEQTEYAANVRKLNLERKEYLMEHPAASFY